MSIILSSIGFLAASIFIYISFQVRDEVESQVTRMLSMVIFLLSFLFSPLLVKLVMVLALIFTWPYVGDRLSLSFYRQLNK